MTSFSNSTAYLRTVILPGQQLEEIDAVLDNYVDAEDLRSPLRTVRCNFTRDDEPLDPIVDWAYFHEPLRLLAYRPVNAAQEQSEASSPVSAAPI